MEAGDEEAAFAGDALFAGPGTLDAGIAEVVAMVAIADVTGAGGDAALSGDWAAWDGSDGGPPLPADARSAA